MNVRWDMSFFMFVSFVGASFLLCSILTTNCSRRPLLSIVSAVAAATSFAIIVAGLNNPAKIITILSVPYKGFSSAVSMQVIVIVASLFVFFKIRENSKVVSAIVLVVSLASVISLSRIYMISTRPALNSILVSLMLIVLLFQTACIMSGNGTSVLRRIIPAVSAVYGVTALAFVVRLKMLAPQDRILNFMEVTSGYIAPLYWSMILCTFIIPFSYACANAVKDRGKAALVVSAVNAVGVFLLFLIICQTPVIARGINNRIFFN